jgi:cysteine desulfurase
MLEAMDAVGNPSSVHAEGRVAKGIVERARAQVADLAWCDPANVVFTSGATEAIGLACTGANAIHCGDWEHDAVLAWREKLGGQQTPFSDFDAEFDATSVCAVQGANSEVGFIGLPPMLDGQRVLGGAYSTGRARVLEDVTQLIAKSPYGFSRGSSAHFAALSGHKFGAPKGVGALLVRAGVELTTLPTGHEMGRRAGTENVIGIAGIGAAAEAAKRDLSQGIWDRVEKLRNILENALAAASNETIFVGKEVDRLPNTSCFITPGWKGETQVMQMDLAGFAISSGSACSSGKVKSSRVLRAMGYSDEEASSAVRVSLGPTTTKDDVLRFADAWTAALKKRRDRAA